MDRRPLAGASEPEREHEESNDERKAPEGGGAPCDRKLAGEENEDSVTFRNGIGSAFKSGVLRRKGWGWLLPPRAPGEKKMKRRALFEMRSASKSHSIVRGRRDDVAGVTSGASSIHQAHGSIAVASRGRGAARSQGTGLEGSLPGWLQVQGEVLPPTARSGARERVPSEHGFGGSGRKERQRRAPWGAPLLHASLALSSFASTRTTDAKRRRRSSRW